MYPRVVMSRGVDISWGWLCPRGGYVLGVAVSFGCGYVLGVAVSFGWLSPRGGCVPVYNYPVGSICADLCLCRVSKQGQIGLHGKTPHIIPQL